MARDIGHVDGLAWQQREGIRGICASGSTGTRTHNGIQIQTRLRVPIVKIVNGEQMVRLRAHIGYAQEHIGSQLALNREIVLLRILRPQMGLKFSIEQKRAEQRPVYATRRPTGIGARRGWSLLDDRSSVVGG